MAYKDYPNREEWLKGRKQSIGASEAAMAIGLSAFKSPLELWKEKTGRKEPDDLSGDERVGYGTQAEEHIRALFALQKKAVYDVEYHAYRVFIADNAPFMTCTLDGELVDKATGERGIWECKTAWITSRQDLNEWRERIPDKYYIQVLYQMAVTGRKYAVLTAQLIFMDGNSEIRHYEINADDCRDDMDYIVREVKEFWQYVENDKTPPTMITL